jgi:hypothetical protein
MAAAEFSLSWESDPSNRQPMQVLAARLVGIARIIPDPGGSLALKRLW